MSKSVWLLSAALVTIATPAFGQSTSQSNTDTDKGSAQPTEGATAEAAAVQDQARERQPVDTSDIVITATRRNEALSDVPMAVSAVTAQTLEYTGASDIRQLNQVAPSLLVSSTSSEAGAGVARIRGIGTVGDNPGLESSVGVFVDGVYRSRAGVALTELGALDRIEVLRNGPRLRFRIIAGAVRQLDGGVEEARPVEVGREPALARERRRIGHVRHR